MLQAALACSIIYKLQQYSSSIIAVCDFRLPTILNERMFVNCWHIYFGAGMAWRVTGQYHTNYKGRNWWSRERPRSPSSTQAVFPLWWLGQGMSNHLSVLVSSWCAALTAAGLPLPSSSSTPSWPLKGFQLTMVQTPTGRTPASSSSWGLWTDWSEARLAPLRWRRKLSSPNMSSSSPSTGKSILRRYVVCSCCWRISWVFKLIFRSVCVNITLKTKTRPRCVESTAARQGCAQPGKRDEKFSSRSREYVLKITATCVRLFLMSCQVVLVVTCKMSSLTCVMCLSSLSCYFINMVSVCSGNYWKCLKLKLFTDFTQVSSSPVQ